MDFFIYKSNSPTEFSKKVKDIFDCNLPDRFHEVYDENKKHAQLAGTKSCIYRLETAKAGMGL